MIQTRKEYSKEFKSQAVELAKAGRPVPDLAAELRPLRAEISQLKLENDILKKAAVILGAKPQPRGAR
jgi:transposase-like protein